MCHAHDQILRPSLSCINEIESNSISVGFLNDLPSLIFKFRRKFFGSDCEIDIRSHFLLSGLGRVVNEVPGRPIEGGCSTEEKQCYHSQWLNEFGKPFLNHSLLGFLFALLCIVFLVLAIHFNWSGPAGLFWIAAFLLGFLAVHKLTSRERHAEKIVIRWAVISDDKAV